MKRRISQDVVRHQKSVFYHTDHEPDGDLLTIPRDLYTRMFTEDASLGVMPIGGRSRRKEFKIELVPRPIKEVAAMIAGALATSTHSYREDLSAVVCEFARGCAAQICANDRATYEIVFHEDPQAKKLTGFELAFIPEHQLVTQGSRVVQIVPPEVAVKRGCAARIPFSEDELLIIEAPMEFRRDLRKMREGLRRLAQLPLSGLTLESSQKGIPYDFNAHHRTMKLALADVVRAIGWNVRGTFNDSVLSYYWIERDIRFHRFKIEMRQAILSALNGAIRRVGKKLGFEVEITVSGLPTVQDTVEASTKLRSGEKAFTEVMDVFTPG